MQTQYKVFAVPVDVAFSTSTGQRNRSIYFYVEVINPTLVLRK
jgi:hypothetical protein